MTDDCLFCRLYREGDHIARAEGFVAIRDIHPQAATHLLILPERHVSSFHDIGEFPADEFSPASEAGNPEARRSQK